MNEVEKLIREYLGSTKMLQIASSNDQQPWICTVYYAYDDDLSIYWISTPDSRHSKEIMKNPKVAAAIAFSQEPYPKDGVRGLQLEGVAELLKGEDEERASKLYVNQLMREKTLLEDTRSGKNPHKFYRIRPSMFVLFDSVNFPEESRQEWRVKI